MNTSSLIPSVIEKEEATPQEQYQKRVDRIFEILTTFTAVLVFFISALFYRDEIDIIPTFFLVVTIIILTFIFYRILPQERHIGFVHYSFEDRSLLVNLSTTVVVGFLIFISGGLESPFFFLYFLLIVASAIILTPVYLLVELFEVSLLVLLTASLYDQTSFSLLFDTFAPLFTLSIFTLWFSNLLKVRGDALEKAYERLKRLNELKSDFFTLTFNQIKSPLTGLRWFLHDTVLVGTNLGESQKSFFFQTYEQILKMISLVNNLRDLVYIESGEEEELTFSKIDLTKVIDDVFSGYKTLISWREIQFIFSKPEGGVAIEGASLEQISHVFQTLISNAIFYNRKSGKIVVEIKQEPGLFHILVEDTGYGIRDEEKDRIFTKFFRGDDAKRIDPSGPGIGLFIAKKIVEWHGGKIWFDSEYQKGTTFHVVLPLRTPYAAS